MPQFVYEEAFVQTHGNLWSIWNDCLRPSWYFQSLSAPVLLCTCKKRWGLIKMLRPPKVKRKKLWICQSAVDTRQEGFFMRSILGYVSNKNTAPKRKKATKSACFILYITISHPQTRIGKWPSVWLAIYSIWAMIAYAPEGVFRPFMFL